MEEQIISPVAEQDETPSGNKLLTFISPYLAYIDNGQMFRNPFSWLYIAIAVINLLWPLVILYELIDNQIFEQPFKIAITLLLIWVVIAIAGWISFQLWWDRKTKITFPSTDNAEFAATPALAHLVQTFGEWIGTWIGFVGTFAALFTSIFLAGEGYQMQQIPLVGDYLHGGFAYVVLMPLFGFLIIVLARFFAEQIKALSAIANNTKSK